MSGFEAEKSPGKFSLLSTLALLSFVLTALAYGLSLSVTFISEDWIHVLVAQHILSGDHALLLDSFTRPWLQTSRVGLFYRPLVDMTFLWDVLVRQLLQVVTNQYTVEFAPVFRLTNLFLHGMTSCLVGLITYLLTKKVAGIEPRLAAVIGCALTAANPLSIETLLWIICRCDGLATCLCLGSIFFYLLTFSQPNKKTLYQAISLAAFFLALLAKETAFILPLIIFLVWAFFYRQQKHSSRSAFFYLAILAIFLPLRALAIGGMGGYQTSMGELLEGSMLSHFLNNENWLRIAFPYNQSFYDSSKFNFLPLLYAGLYLTLGGALIWRHNKNHDLRILFFTASSFFIALLPAKQVFMILPTLFGARTLYLPECFLFIWLGYALAQMGRPLFAKVWTLSLVSLMILTSNMNVAVFNDYSKIVQKLTAEIKDFHLKKPMALLSLANLPFNYKVGAIIGEVWQMRTACAGTRGELNDMRMVTSTVAYHPHPDLFNSQRALRQIQDANSELLCILPGRSSKAALHYISVEVRNNWAAMSPCSFAGDKFVAMPTRVLNLKFEENSFSASNLQGTDFVEVLVRKSNKKETANRKNLEIKIVEAVPRFYPLPDPDKRITLLWHTEYSDMLYPNTSLAAPFDQDSPLVLYRFPVSDKFSFKCAPCLKDLTVIGLPDQGFVLESVTLTNGHSLIPLLLPRSLQGEEDLIYGAISTRGEPIEFNYDCTGIEGADKALIEITSPDAAFIHTTGTLMEWQPRKSSVLSWQQEGVRGTVKIDSSKMPVIGRYQVRVMAIDTEGKTKGYFSFPQDIVYNPEGFGAIDKPQEIDFRRMIFDSRPNKN